MALKMTLNSQAASQSTHRSAISSLNWEEESERIKPNFVPSVRTNGREDQKFYKIAAFLLSASPSAAKTDVAQKLESHQNEVGEEERKEGFAGKPPLSPKRSLVPETQARKHFAWLRNVRIGDLEIARTDQTTG